MINEVIPNQIAVDQQPAMLKAAAQWRMPYWDWAANNEVPVLAQNPTIQVQTVAGTSTIKNPLYSFNLPQGKTFGTMGPNSNQNYVVTSADGFPVCPNILLHPYSS
jgi:hypothetical protein